MASIKIKFRPSTVSDREGTVYYQIIHRRQVRQLSTEYRVKECEWNAAALQSLSPNPAGSGRVRYADTLRGKVQRDLNRLSALVRSFEDEGVAYTADDVVAAYNSYRQECSLSNFMTSAIIKLKRNGKIRTAETYISALNSFRKFCGSDIMLDSITSELMESYEAYLQGRGAVANTTSFYMRILRAVYNKAVDKGLIEQCNPFRHVYTGIGKTVKRALPLKIIRGIKALDLSHNSKLDYSRDMFLMSFYLRGMSFVDMAFLRKKDLKNGYVIYRRRKTGQLLTIKWTKEMQVIIDKYPRNATGYLLPIIRRCGVNEHNAYRNASFKINRDLKKIAKMIGVTVPLTLYVARHSWASAAKAKGIPLSVISEGMGHNSEATTQIYLASLDTSVVDRANALILSSI